MLTTLRSQAENTPYQPLYTFVAYNGSKVSSLNCQETWRRAQQIAQGLLINHQVSPGERVLLVYPPGLEFIEAFLGCLYAGIIPVPVPPPNPINPEVGLFSYTEIALDCEAVAQLTSQSYSTSRAFGRIRQALSFGKKWPKLPWIVTDLDHPKITVSPIQPKDEQIAFLQYTSGSTRKPKGVCISFGNIMHQILSNRAALGMSPHGKSLIWMPHYHDFTLISGILNAACGNNQLILFSPLEFMRRPALWGDLLHRFKATHTAGPDFGYKLLTQRTTLEQRSAWDLSSLQMVMSAAEPIHASTVDNFLTSFTQAKLDPLAFCPSYGLAEHTVAVSVRGRHRFKVDRELMEQKLILKPALSETSCIELFGCGVPNQDIKVKIVDPVRLISLPEGSIGEIWVNSPSKAHGYYGHPDETKNKFEARLVDADDESSIRQGWLRTGDLGALYQGEIVIAGRLDDMIILNGRNIFPQDIEHLIASCDKQIKPGRVIAFGAQSSTDIAVELVAVLELKKNRPTTQELSSIAYTIRNLLQQELRVSQITLVFAKRGSVPKTTSGKLQRKKCRTLWLSGKMALHGVHSNKLSCIPL